MPEPEILVIGLRHLERLLIVASGALAIWLGYRVFLAMPQAAEGESKVQLPGGISIYVSRVGPGVFFALFGALLLGVSMQQTVQFSVADPGPGRKAAAADADARPGLAYSGIAGAGPAPDPRPEDRARVADTAGQLARVAAFLEGPAGAALAPERRVDAANALREARVLLLASVWNEGAWGRFADFRLWLETEAEPPPPGVAAAARAYRGVP